MSKTSIEWTQDSWNPIVGCSLATPGCTNCYAMAMAARIEAMNISARAGELADGKRRTMARQYDGTTRQVNGKPVWTGHVAMAPDSILLAPLKRKKPTTYFVNSMGDLFHEDVPDEWIDKVFAVMALTPQHTYQVLTKRSQRMRAYLSMARAHAVGLEALGLVMEDHARNTNSTLGAGIVLHGDIAHLKVWPLPSVWLGVSTERQKEADERIPDLLATPAALRFISAEPLLGPIDLESAWCGENALRSECWGDCRWCDRGFPRLHNCARSYPAGGSARATREAPSLYEGRDRSGLDWVIVGGESGPDARPMHPDWARDLRDQCDDADVKFFFKQWGAWYPIIDRDKDDPDWRANYGRATHQPDKFRILNFAGGCGFHGGRVHLMQRYSKSAAGRTLDGLIHDEYPERA